jgi:succinate dehydrogenase / fumarate reductase cytochrome b subunit
MRPVDGYPGGGMWSWLLQRVTGLLLVVYLFIHLWVLHYANMGEVTFDRILSRLQSPAFLVFDLMLLALVIFHALNGVMMVVIDLGIGQRAQRMLFWGLVLLGLALFLFGVYALWPFISS